MAWPSTAKGQERASCPGRIATAYVAITTFLFHPAFPVDIRHNAKIFREKLAVWAAKELA